MDLFQHRYYRLTKYFMMIFGLWPYQSVLARRGTFVIVLFIGLSALPPSVLAFVKYRDDLSIILDCVNIYMFAVICLIKLSSIVWNSQKILKLLNRICTNWQVWAQDRHINILHEYAERGEKMTTMYTAAIYSCIIIYITQPVTPKIIDVILKNGNAVGKFPYPVDYYFFAAQKYYCYIMAHIYIVACVAAVPVVASSNMLIIYVHHICGVFAALGHKLVQIGSNDTSEENVKHISSLIARHNDAIEYANLIEATYRWDFFIVVGLGIILINLLGVQILIRTNEPESTIRFIAFALSLELVLYVDCNISQVLTDHSVNIRFYIYNSQWYRLLPRDQKDLQMMIMRCRVPCQLTAGNMVIMSIRNFGMTIRTAMSYFAVIRSMDRLNIQ